MASLSTILSEYSTKPVLTPELAIQAAAIIRLFPDEITIRDWYWATSLKSGLVGPEWQQFVAHLPSIVKAQLTRAIGCTPHGAILQWANSEVIHSTS